MNTRTLTFAICLAAPLAISVNAAHAGFLKNTANLAKGVVVGEKIILKSKMTSGERLKSQGKLGLIATKCFIKGATSKPCI